MIEGGEDALRVRGPMTIREAMRLREGGMACIGERPCRVDLSGVEAVDSSALAVLLAWQRRARSLGGELEFRDPPESLVSLAGLYRLGALLGAGD